MFVITWRRETALSHLFSSHRLKFQQLKNQLHTQRPALHGL